MVEVGDRLTALAHQHGFHQGPDPESRDEREGTAWWFYRSGATFRTEIVAFRVVWEPNPDLETHLFGSDLSPDELATRGISGNAAGFNLFMFEYDHLKVPPRDLLPQGVELHAAFLDDSFARLDAEIERAEKTIWVALRRAWQRSWLASSE